MNDRFAQFDYGEGNKQQYGSDQPPLIDLGRVNLNAHSLQKEKPNFTISMFVGSDDKLSMPENAKWARNRIGRDIVTEYTEIDHFSHTSFNFGKDMSYLDDVIKLVLEANTV